MRLRSAESDRIGMPDTSHQRDRVNDFARNAPALASTSGRVRNGGVLLAPNGKSYIVNVRPPRWKDENKPSQFWIGKIVSLEVAQHWADAVLHYCGKARFHFGNVDFTFPPLECMGTVVGIPVWLTTTEQCRTYVESIAGDGFAPQRKDFVRRVTNMIKSAEFSLQGERFRDRVQNSVVVENAAAAFPEEEPAALPSEEPAALPREEPSSLPREEPASLPRAESARIDDNDARADRETPVEEDDSSFWLRANLVSGYAPSQATVAGFELNAGVSGGSLQSVEESLGPMYYNPADCPAVADEGWRKAIEELNNSSACGGIMNSATGASPAAVASTSNIPSSVFKGVSFLSGTKFVVVASRELVLSPGIVHGIDSEDVLSLQPVMNSPVHVSSVDHPSDWTPRPPSCQPSVPPVSRRPEVNAALMLSCEQNDRRVVEDVQAQSFLMPFAYRVLSSDSTASHMTAEAKHLINSKRQRIGD